MIHVRLSLSFCCGLIVGIFTFSSEAAVTTTNKSSSTQIAASSVVTESVITGLTVVEPKDGLKKRNIKVITAHQAEAKSLDTVQPEYYNREPGLLSSSTYNNRDQNRFNAIGGFIPKPITFPTDQRDSTGNGYDNWKGIDSKETTENDRISFDQYKTDKKADSDSRSSSSSSSTVSHSYRGTYKQFPYDTSIGHHVYGIEHKDDGGIVGYYDGGSDEREPPFNGYYHNKGYHHHHHHPESHIGVSEYPSYPYESHSNHGHSKHKGFQLSHKALLAKSFLIPLASAAVLGITAALVSNPLLLQLGTVSGSAVGKRKRRDLLNRQLHGQRLKMKAT